jgi:hypothetical protein
MKFTEIGTFEIAHENLSWPWFVFDATGTRVAYPASQTQISSGTYDGTAIVRGANFSLPAGLTLADLSGFSLERDGAHLALVTTTERSSQLVVCSADGGGEPRHVSIESLMGAGFIARAVCYDRKGERMWVSAESATECAIALVDAVTFALVGQVRSPNFPPLAMHEFALHPVDDAVLLLAACGQDGTFARVVGWSGETVEAIATALDEGAVPAGFVGFSADAARVHLAEADELRTHAWPGLQELSSVQLADDFVSSYAGAVFGEHIFIDGRLEDSDEDAVMRFDRSAIRGGLMKLPVPEGMWAGRIGRDAIVTVDPKQTPALARLLRIALPDTSN